MATTYFGYCNATTGDGTGSGTCNLNQRLYWHTAGYACPGSGAQTLLSFGLQGRSTGTANIGIYTTAGARVAYGTAAKVFPNDTTFSNQTWTEWVAADITWSSGTTLTGGTTYLIAVCCSTNGPNIFGNASAPANTLQYSGATDYTSAMPSTLPASNGYTYEYNLRVAVEPAAGGSIAPIAMYYRMSQ